ncbi:thyrotropin-releasing hormone-degrading ectoenzyme-like isoform X2 [Nylanderia fulva]|uniref:thyrotropin-releasing hormone-degrading ectoenzyme-like isoform X2 n=1 Tax=Nylanderia fulva TaxID=613905 RepID=UPI0010FB4160|nr:thyrotropin-releasing hormone-degrading ectoenzyme-like isoform X2 [Nylanderia fulva]
MMVFLKLLLNSGLIFIAATAFIRNKSRCYEPPKYVKPIHYNIKFTSEIEENIFYGEYNISINILNKTQHIYLQLEKSCIYNIYLFTNNGNYENEKDAVYKPTYNRNEDTINIVFGVELSPGNYTLYIEYSGKFDKSFGIFNVERKTTRIAALHFHIIGSQQLIPCWNYRYSLETTFSISIKCNQCVALSNMPLPNIERDENNVLWTHFNTTPAISPHLVTMLLSNNLINLNNKTRGINMWGRHESRLDIQYAESVAEDITLYFQTYWNRSNSITHVTHAVIPNFHDKSIIVFGLVLYREVDIIFNKVLYPVARAIQVAQLVGHKVAQEWFYNLNNPFQSTFWFNEGLTGLLATIAVDKMNPRYRIMNLFVVQNQHNSFSLDGDYHMWNSSLRDDSLFNIRKSIRAPFLLRMVQHAFTEELFWKSVRPYAFDNQSLLHFLEEIDTAVGKTHFAIRIINNWQLETHCPIIKIIRNHTDDHSLHFVSEVIVLIQNTDTLKIDCLPVTFTTEASPNFNNFTNHMLCVKKNLKLSLTFNQPGWMIFNVQQVGYYRVNYDIENWQRISHYLHSENYTKIHVLNRAQIIDDAFHLMIADQLGSYIFWDIIGYLHQEEDYIAWYPMFKALEYMFGTFSAFGEQCNNVKERIRAILFDVLRKIRYEVVDQAFLRNCLRYEAARWACFFGDITCKKEANNKLKQYIIDIKLRSFLPWQQEWIYCNGLMITTINETTWELVFAIGVFKSDAKFLEYLACPEDIDVIIYYLKNKRYHSIKREYQLDVNSFLHIITKHAKNPTILKYILDHFNEVKPKEINIIAALIIIINNNYSDNLLQRILVYVGRIFDANVIKVNNTECLFEIHQIKESDILIKKINLYDYILRQISNRNGQIRRRKQYFERFIL